MCLQFAAFGLLLRAACEPPAPLPAVPSAFLRIAPRAGPGPGGPSPGRGAEVHAAAPRAPVPEVHTVAEYQKMLEHGAGPVVAVFTSPYCGPCLLAEPHIEAMASELAPRLRIFKLKLAGTSVRAFKKISSELEVSVLPTFVVYNKMQVVGKVAGSKAADVRSIVQQELSRTTAFGNQDAEED